MAFGLLLTEDQSLCSLKSCVCGLGMHPWGLWPWQSLGQSPGLVHSQAGQEREKLLPGKGETPDQRARFGECRPVHRSTGWAWLGFAQPKQWDRDRAAPTSTPTGEHTPPASPILLPGDANPKGMKSRCLVLAVGWQFPMTTPCSWTWTTQPEALHPHGQQHEAGCWGKPFPALQ